MSENLAAKIESNLPPELIEFLRRAGDAAAARGSGLFLVGGVVRDLLLGLKTLDLDLVVEGDAIALAKALAEANEAKIVVHKKFGTARLHWREWAIDLATARAETYSRPGALPDVRPATIQDDLFRRDFTINAMAAYLHPERYGELLDRFGGRADLEKKRIRILHEKSFIDDATRIWRAVRYEQRLGFRLESGTGTLLKRDIPMLRTISADRIRYEIECVFREEFPEKVLRRAGELGVLEELAPGLAGNGWLAAKYEAARRNSAPERPSFELYLALLACRLGLNESESLVERLNLPSGTARVVREARNLTANLESLDDPGATPGQVFDLLQGYSTEALRTVRLASDLPGAARNIELFLDKLRYVKPLLGGSDLKALGVKAGPDMGEALDLLHRARLDGRVATREDEERLVREWAKTKG